MLVVMVFSLGSHFVVRALTCVCLLGYVVDPKDLATINTYAPSSYMMEDPLGTTS
jgi:hypothetical protein